MLKFVVSFKVIKLFIYSASKVLTALKTFFSCQFTMSVTYLQQNKEKIARDIVADIRTIIHHNVLRKV